MVKVIENDIEYVFDYPVYEGKPRLKPPYGLVILPSFWLDTCYNGWIEAIKKYRAVSATVNLAFLSARLREADALPDHAVMIDNPHRMIKRNIVGVPIAEFEKYYHDTDVTIWGGYDYWCRKRRIHQQKVYSPGGYHLSRWIVKEEFSDSQDPYVHKVAGQYSSCAACNIVSHLIGWTGTVFVIGNAGQGRYCKLEVFVDKPILTENSTKVPAADNYQWSFLYQQAIKTGIEIVHVYPSRVTTLPVLGETKALEVLNANN